MMREHLPINTFNHRRRGNNAPLEVPYLALANAYGNNPVRSPVDHSVIDSRQSLHEHNMRNGVIDVGNDSAAKMRQQKKMVDKRELEKDIKDSYDQIEQNNEKALHVIEQSKIDRKRGLNIATREYVPGNT